MQRRRARAWTGERAGQPARCAAAVCSGGSRRNTAPRAGGAHGPRSPREAGDAAAAQRAGRSSPAAFLLTDTAALTATGQNVRKLVKDGLVIRKPVKIHSRSRLHRRLEAKGEAPARSARVAGVTRPRAASRSPASHDSPAAGARRRQRRPRSRAKHGVAGGGA